MISETLIIRVYYAVCFTIMLSALVILNVSSNAENLAEPELHPVKIVKETNDPGALDQAKKIKPDFFEVDRQFMTENPEDVFFAKYLPLAPNQPMRFIAFTAQNTSYYCAKLGCPYYIFERKSGNEPWTLALSLLTPALFYDPLLEATENQEIADLASVHVNPHTGEQSLMVWRWNGEYFAKKEAE